MVSAMNVLDELLGLLTLEQTETDVFIGQSQDLGFRRLFGGQVLGQADVVGAVGILKRFLYLRNLVAVFISIFFN